jgi:hypothetical protein
MKWTEPFTTGKPQTLRLEIHTWPAEKRLDQPPRRAALVVAQRPMQMVCQQVDRLATP